jgi:hypothetical protein
MFGDEGKDVEHRSCALGCGSAGPAEQQDAGSGRAGQREQRPEVGVGCDDISTIGWGLGEDVLIGGAAEAEVDDVYGVAAGLAEDACEILLERFVDEQLHAASGSVAWSAAAAANCNACRTSSSTSWESRS